MNELKTTRIGLASKCRLVSTVAHDYDLVDMAACGETVCVQLRKKSTYYLSFVASGKLVELPGYARAVVVPAHADVAVVQCDRAVYQVQPGAASRRIAEAPPRGTIMGMVDGKPRYEQGAHGVAFYDSDDRRAWIATSGKVAPVDMLELETAPASEHAVLYARENGPFVVAGAKSDGTLIGAPENALACNGHAVLTAQHGVLTAASLDGVPICTAAFPRDVVTHAAFADAASAWVLTRNALYRVYFEEEALGFPNVAVGLLKYAAAAALVFYLLHSASF